MTLQQHQNTERMKQMTAKVQSVGSVSWCCSVVNVFQVTRAVENTEFRSDVGNVRLLSHASHVENFVGILSRFDSAAAL